MINHIANTYIVEASHTSALPGIIILAILLMCLPVTAADLAVQYYGDGVNFSHAGKYADALVSYEKAVFIRPNYAEAWLNRGVALDYLGRYDEAIASYDKVIDLQPNLTTARENREIALTKESRFNPTNIGVLVLIIVVISGVVIWYTKPKTLFDKNPFQKKPEQPKEEAKKPEMKPETKQLYYGTIPDESRLHTLASLCAVMNVAGVYILDDPEKVSALLDEYSRGEYERERTILILALKDKIPQELLKSHRGFTLINKTVKLSRRLMENHKMPEDLARWAIETWAKALETEK